MASSTGPRRPFCPLFSLIFLLHKYITWKPVSLHPIVETPCFEYLCTHLYIVTALHYCLGVSVQLLSKWLTVCGKGLMWSMQLQRDTEPLQEIYQLSLALDKFCIFVSPENVTASKTARRQDWEDAYIILWSNAWLCEFLFSAISWRLALRAGRASTTSCSWWIECIPLGPQPNHMCMLKSCTALDSRCKSHILLMIGSSLLAAVCMNLQQN